MYIGHILAKSQCYYKSLKYVRYTELPVLRQAGKTRSWHGNSSSRILQILRYYELTDKRIIFSSVCTSSKTPKFHPSGFPNLFSTPAGAFSQFLFLSALNRPVFSEELKRNRLRLDQLKLKTLQTKNEEAETLLYSRRTCPFNSSPHVTTLKVLIPLC